MSPTAARMNKEMAIFMSTGSVDTRTKVPNGAAMNAGMAKGSKKARSEWRIAVGIRKNTAGSPIRQEVATATTGLKIALKIMIIISALPNPTNPRMNPASTMVATTMDNSGTEIGSTDGEINPNAVSIIGHRSWTRAPHGGDGKTPTCHIARSQKRQAASIHTHPNYQPKHRIPITSTPHFITNVYKLNNGDNEKNRRVIVLMNRNASLT